MNRYIDQGLQTLLTHDKYLLEQEVNERSVTHKLGEYYQRIFFKWNVDCEYNKHFDQEKVIEINPKRFLEQMASYLEMENVDMLNKEKWTSYLKEHEDISQSDIDNLKSQLTDPHLIYDEELDVVSLVLEMENKEQIIKTIFPDIIVHQRGTANNFVVVEAKKSTNHNKQGRLYDLVKLFTLVDSEKFKYQYGFFVNIPAGNDLVRHKDFKFQKLGMNEQITKVESKRM